MRPDKVPVGPSSSEQSPGNLGQKQDHADATKPQARTSIPNDWQNFPIPSRLDTPLWPPADRLRWALARLDSLGSAGKTTLAAKKLDIEDLKLQIRLWIDGNACAEQAAHRLLGSAEELLGPLAPTPRAQRIRGIVSRIASGVMWATPPLTLVWFAVVMSIIFDKPWASMLGPILGAAMIVAQQRSVHARLNTTPAATFGASATFILLMAPLFTGPAETQWLAAVTSLVGTAATAIAGSTIQWRRKR